MPQPIVKINAATNCQNQCLNVLNHYRNSILKLLPQLTFKITAATAFLNNCRKQLSKSLPQ